MFDIPVFAKERDAGLETLIRANATIAYQRPVSVVAPFEVSDRAQRASAEWARATNQNQVDLHYLSTILVTTGWNLNDDVFDQTETFLARATPEDKPFNYEHDCSDIIGHITASRLIDAELVPLSEAQLEKLPAKFHIQTGAVLYKVWTKPELQERMDAMLPEIAKGEWFVSMEAMFHGFDYAVQSDDGAQRVVARNEETAFLTKYMRAYGGTGKYEGYRIGRLLRSIVFCGKGLVRKPANPESVIFDEPATFDGRTVAGLDEAHRKNLYENSGLLKKPVYAVMTFDSSNDPTQDKNSKTSEQPQMTDLEKMEKTISDLKLENEALVKAAKETAENAAKVEIEKLNKENVALKASVSGLTDEKESLSKSLAAAELKVTELTGAHKTAADELAGLKASARRAERIQTVVAKTKATVEAATKLVDTTQSLSDEQFATNIELMASAMAGLVPPSATTASTDSPEDDGEEDSEEVDETALDETEAETTSAGLAGGDTEPEAGLNDVQKAIAAFFAKPAAK